MGTTAVLEGGVIFEIYKDCVADPRTTTSYVAVENFSGREVRFDQRRLDEHRTKIEALLNQLPDTFKTADGAHALEMSLDRRGVLWNRLPEPFEQLFLLGRAIKRIEFTRFRLKEDGLPFFRVK